ncbi:MAG: threonine/serine exporter family protein, partial [Myxococcota bacterium]
MTSQMTPGAREAFIMSLGGALHRWGIPAHRLEDRMTEVATRIGLEAQFFSTPTSLMAGFGSLANQQVRLIRSDPGNVDLSKLADLDRVADEVAQGELSIDKGLAQVMAIDERPALYRGPIVIAAFSLAAAGSSRF